MSFFFTRWQTSAHCFKFVLGENDAVALTLQCLRPFNETPRDRTGHGLGKKRKQQNKHVNRGKAAVLAPAPTSGERSSSQIINDTLPSHNYAQIQRGRKQSIHTSMTKRIHAADRICCTCDVVDSSQRVKMHREAESDGGAREWAKHLLLQNTSRLPRRRRVITLYGTFGFRHFTANCGNVGRDYTWLCRAVWFFHFFSFCRLRDCFW